MPGRTKLFVKKEKGKLTHIQLRIDAVEKGLLAQRAEAAGMSLSSYLIQAGLQRGIRSQSAIHLIEELRVLSMQIKLLAETREINIEQCAETLLEIKRVMLAIWNKEIRL